MRRRGDIRTWFNWRLQPTSVCVTLTLLLFVGSGCGFVGTGAQVSRPVHPVYHIVQPGENLYQLGLRYRVPHEQIALLNGIRDARTLAVGQRLLIRYGGDAKVSGGSRSASSERRPRVERATYAPPTKDRVEMLQREEGILRWPMTTGEIVSRFGPRQGSFHDGIDIAAPAGAPIYAAHDGVVVYSNNRLHGYGNLIIVRDNKGLTTVYAHCRRRLVREGQRVRRGELIAEVGSTGHSSGPHLHFEVRTKDIFGRYVAVDPIPLLTNSGRKPRFRVNESLTPILARLNPFN